jgi:hypothetical protein
MTEMPAGATDCTPSRNAPGALPPSAAVSLRAGRQISTLRKSPGHDGGQCGLGIANILQTFVMHREAPRCYAVALDPSGILCIRVVYEG